MLNFFGIFQCKIVFLKSFSQHSLNMIIWVGTVLKVQVFIQFLWVRQALITIIKININNC